MARLENPMTSHLDDRQADPDQGGWYVKNQMDQRTGGGDPVY